MNYNSTVTLLITDLLEDPSQIRNMSICELRKTKSWIETGILIEQTPDLGTLYKSVVEALELREKYGYKNQSYNGSDLQSKVHKCSNTIEKARASLYRNRKFIPKNDFDDAVENFNDLSHEFSGIAEDIREGLVPSNRPSVYKKRA